jgi:hypothetical protein
MKKKKRCWHREKKEKKKLVARKKREKEKSHVPSSTMHVRAITMHTCIEVY